MIKNFLLLLLVSVMIFGCSKVNEKNGQEQLDGEIAYMALNFTNSPKSTNIKANIGVPGTPAEDAMAKATVLLFDENNRCLGSKEFSAFISTPATESQEVPAKTKKIFVSINNNNAKWNLSSSAVINKLWDDINTAAEISIADIATDNAFMMTNVGNIADGALVAVTIYETPELAKASPTEVSVNRVSSKIIVDGTNPAPANVPDAVFDFKGWNLNTINKTTYLYSEQVMYDNNQTNAVAGVYRIDKNYKYADFKDIVVPVDLTKYLTDNFIWLSNGTSSATMSKVDLASNSVLYSTENTMEADAQRWGVTTKVVIKATYTPKNDVAGPVAANSSYFSLGGKYYSTATMTLEYKKVDRAHIKTDLMAFLIDVDATYEALNPVQQLEEANIDAAIGRLDDYSGVKAKKDGAMRYFHQSVCFYDALIRHDDNVSVPMALGRYGVVRNNAYTISINSVKGPGTPWIPDPTDPTDPTDPKDPDDPKDANLSIKVTVNPWTAWAHAVDLG